MPPEFDLGTIPARGFNWDEVSYPVRRLGDVVILRYGKALPESTRQTGAVPVYGTNGQCGFHAQPLAPGPGVILGRKGQGHLGVEWCESDFWVIDTAYYAHVDQRELDLRWFYYLTSYVGLDHLKTGEKPGLQRDVFCAQVVPFPPIDVQRGVARILATLDDKIALNQRMNRTLETMAAALFRSWFIEFTPVSSKAEARREVGLSAAMYDAMPSRFVEDADGEIPAGWTREPIDRLLRITKDGTSPAETPDEIFDHYSIPAFDEGALPAREAGGAIRSGKLRVPVDAVLISKLNPHTPRVWWPAAAIHERSVCSTEFMPCVPRQGVPREFLHELFRSAIFADGMATLVTGTSNSHQRVKPEDFLRLRVVLPDKAVMCGFANIVGPMLERCRHNVLENGMLAALRDILLPQLLSGAIRLRDADAMAAVVA